MGEEAQMERGLAQLAAGDLAAARAAFAAAASAQPEAPQPRFYLALSHALAGDVAGLLAAMAAQGDAADAQLEFFHVVLLGAFQRKAWPALLRIAAATPPGSRQHAVALYYGGCAELAQNRYDAAFDYFRRFRDIVLPHHREFPLLTSEHMNLVFRQGCLIEAPEMVAALLRQTPPASAPAIERIGEWQPAPQGPVLLACADAAYFQRFAPELLRSAAARRPDLTLHLHVIGDEPDSVAAARDAGHPRLNLSVERAPPNRHRVYYACNRFLVAPAVMAFHGRTVLALDIDSVLLGDLQPILDAAEGLDVACFTSGRREPASVYQAAALHVDESAGGRRFLDLCGRLVQMKLAMPPELSWMLDQAALFSAIHYARKHAPEIKIGDLTALTGAPLAAFIATAGSMDEKWRLMQGAP